MTKLTQAMQIWLMRHGAAERVGPDIADVSRRLTLAGEEEVASVLRLAAPSMRGAVVLSSPFVRAQQTARLAAREIGVGPPVLTRHLTPESEPSDAWDEIRTHVDGGGLLAVAHLPLIARLAGFILGGAEIHFETATLVAIEVEKTKAQPHGSLRWMVTSRLTLPSRG